MYKSETSLYRDLLVGYCKGYGLDIGYGGDPIKPSAITIDNPEGDMAHCGDHPLNLGGDARQLKWLQDNSLDYVYSSHCLEDFEDTREVMLEWLRVLKRGGKLVLLLPDQSRYEAFCKKRNILPNEAHKIKEFSLLYIKQIAGGISTAKVIFEKDNLGDYNFAIVIEKTKEISIFQRLLYVIGRAGK